MLRRYDSIQIARSLNSELLHKAHVCEYLSGRLQSGRNADILAIRISCQADHQFGQQECRQRASECAQDDNQTATGRQDRH